MVKLRKGATFLWWECGDGFIYHELNDVSLHVSDRQRCLWLGCLEKHCVSAGASYIFVEIDRFVCQVPTPQQGGVWDKLEGGAVSCQRLSPSAHRISILVRFLSSLPPHRVCIIVQLPIQLSLDRLKDAWTFFFKWIYLCLFNFLRQSYSTFKDKIELVNPNITK